MNDFHAAICGIWRVFRAPKQRRSFGADDTDPANYAFSGQINRSRRCPEGCQRLAGGRAPARPPGIPCIGDRPRRGRRACPLRPLRAFRVETTVPPSSVGIAALNLRGCGVQRTEPEGVGARPRSATPSGNAVNDLFGRKMRNLRGPCRRRRNFGAVSALEKHAKSRKLPHENRSRRCPSGSMRRGGANRWFRCAQPPANLWHPSGVKNGLGRPLMRRLRGRQ